MTDLPISFVPAQPEAPANGEARTAPPSAPPTAAAAFDAPTLQRAPMTPEPKMQPVPLPSDKDLPTDTESGFRYRPFVLGGVMVRCASKIPADIMLEVVATQQRLSDKDMADLSQGEQLEMLHLLGQMLSGVVWDEDADKLRARLRDKREPVDLGELSVAIQVLWAEYNEASGVGKEQ